MLRHTFVAVLALASMSGVSANDRAPRERSGHASNINWTYGPENEASGEDQLAITRRGMHSTFDRSEAPAVLEALAESSRSEPGQPVAFAIEREAGALTCTGRVVERGRAAGTCRFDPDEGFVRGLAARGVELDDRDDLLGLTLVDAHLASVDGLKQAGFRVADSGDLMTISALHVTADFAAGLKTAGLEIGDLDDLVSARALGVDPEWLRAMAAAGYPGLDADQAIAMRSLGITPDYARRMARVLASTEGN